MSTMSVTIFPSSPGAGCSPFNTRRSFPSPKLGRRNDSTDLLPIGAVIGIVVLCLPFGEGLVGPKVLEVVPVDEPLSRDDGMIALVMSERRPRPRLLLGVRIVEDASCVLSDDGENADRREGAERGW